jgi:hypothetical protein
MKFRRVVTCYGEGRVHTPQKCLVTVHRASAETMTFASAVIYRAGGVDADCADHQYGGSDFVRGSARFMVTDGREC